MATIQIFALALLFFHLISTTLCFSPVGRDAAAALLVNTDIWVFGGCVASTDPQISQVFVSTNSLFSLSVSESWSTSSPLWTDHSNDLTQPLLVFTRCRSTLQLDADGISLWVFGGQSERYGEDLTDKSPAVRYNIYTHAWSSVTLSNQILLGGLQGLSSTQNNQGEIFYFGGQSDSSTGYDGFMQNDNVITVSTNTGDWNILPMGYNLHGTRLGTATMV